MKTRALLLAVVLCAAREVVPRRAGAQQIQVDAGLSIEKDSVRVGDPFRIIVSIRAPKGATIEFPTALDSSSTVQSIDPRLILTQNEPLGVRQSAVYRVAAWDVGRQPIRMPDITVRLGTASRTITLAGYAVHVVSVLPTDTALRVPKPARPLFERSMIPWWFWAALAAAVALLFALWWWWRRRRRVRPMAAPVDPYVRAQQDFERIATLGLIEAGERSRHVALVVDVLREYIADRFSDAPLALTSTELLTVTQHVQTLPRDRMMRILNDADLVKFAKRPVSPERARDIGQEARALVEHEHVASHPEPADAEGRAA